MAVTQNLKGTSYPSFKIHKSGPTLYQGSVSPSFSASHGDLYLQTGAEGALWLYDNNAWTELGAGGTSVDTTIITNSSNTGSHVKQYVLFGETSDANEHILAPTSAFSIDTTTTTLDDDTVSLDIGEVSGVIPVPLNSANLFEVRVVARSASPNNNAGYSLKGVIVNDAGTTTLINDTSENILAESIGEWYTIVEANDNGDDSFVIKVSGSANTTVRWTAFVTLTSVSTPSYALSSNTNAINEGDSVTFTLTTAHMSNGSSIAYTITGIDQADLSSGSLTGNFVIQNNTATQTFTLAEDAVTEGTENMTLALNNGLASADVVVVTDTSLDPTYTLSADNTTINEGDTVTITLTTTDIADSTNFAYTVTGVDTDDLSAGSLTGNITINSNTGTAAFTLAEDATTEGVETLTLTLDNGQGSIDITITDTSEDAVDTSNFYVDSDYVLADYVSEGGSGITWGGARGLIAGGYTAGGQNTNTIEYINISTPGNATDFGDLTAGRRRGATMSNATRAVFAGGTTSSYSNILDYVTVATPGNAIDFGNMSNGWSGPTAEGDGTYGIMAGGYRYSGTSYYADMEYITIDTPSNTTSFGNLSGNQYGRAMGTNGTIGVIATGNDENNNSSSNSMLTITMATPGNAVSSSGTLLDSWRYVQNLPGDDTYLLVGAGRRTNGEDPNGWTNMVEKFATATQTGATDHGDLTHSGGMSASSSDGTYAFFAGREGSSSAPSGQSNGRYNTIDQMSITTGGSATDFGTISQYIEAGLGSSGNAS